jgi:uncharacterized protein YggT (Ycf19 family)
MPPDRLFQLFTLLRQLAFMVLLYLALGWLAERYVTKPDSKLRAFFRLICSPVTRPVSRILSSDAQPQRVLAVSMAIVGGVWIALIAVSEALAAS